VKKGEEKDFRERYGRRTEKRELSEKGVNWSAFPKGPSNEGVTEAIARHPHTEEGRRWEVARDKTLKKEGLVVGNLRAFTGTHIQKNAIDTGERVCKSGEGKKGKMNINYLEEHHKVRLFDLRLDERGESDRTDLSNRPAVRITGSKGLRPEEGVKFKTPVRRTAKTGETGWSKEPGEERFEG